MNIENNFLKYKKARHRRLTTAILYGLVALWIPIATSCTTVSFQAGSLDQPVLLNKTNHLHKDNSGFTLSAVTTYNATVSRRHAAASSPGYNSTTTKSSTSRSNDAETKVVELMGGDNKKVITDMSFNVDVMCVNALFAIVDSVSIKGNGTVQDIAANAAPVAAESLPEVETPPAAEVVPDTAIAPLSEEKVEAEAPPKELSPPVSEMQTGTAASPAPISQPEPESQPTADEQPKASMQALPGLAPEENLQPKGTLQPLPELKPEVE